ncbi:MAG: serine protease [Rhodospirillaceae bacterium]
MITLLHATVIAGILLAAGTAGAEPPDAAHLGVRVEKPVGDGKLFSQGSGVLIGDGLVLTAAHVVRYNPADPRVTVLVEGRRVVGRLALIDRTTGADIALIRIERAALPAESRNRGVTLCERDPGIDAPVVVASMGEVTRSTIVAAPDKPASKPGDWATTLATGYHHGNSGGGVFDAGTGCLLGIMTTEISGRIRPDAPFLDVTRFTPAPDLAGFVGRYRATAGLR